MYKDVIIGLIAIPVILSFIIVVWGILFTLVGWLIEVYKDWRR